MHEVLDKSAAYTVVKSELSDTNIPNFQHFWQYQTFVAI